MNKRLRQRAFVCLLLTVAACTPTHTMVAVAEFKPVTEPLVVALRLHSGQTLLFDEERGWYNIAQRCFEGKLLSGARDTVSINDVDSVAVYHASPTSTTVRQSFGALFAIIPISVLAIGVLLFYMYFGRH